MNINVVQSNNAIHYLCCHGNIIYVAMIHFNKHELLIMFAHAYYIINICIY